MYEMKEAGILDLEMMFDIVMNSGDMQMHRCSYAMMVCLTVQKE